MEELRLSYGEKQNARIALLRYYSSEGVGHGEYLLAIVFAFLGLAEATRLVFPPPGGLVWMVIFNLMTSSFVVLIVSVVGRTIFWSYMRSAVLRVRPKDGNKIESELGMDTVTFLQQLHEGCLDYVRKKHRIGAGFHGLKVWRLALVWVGLFVVFLTVSLAGPRVV